ncbi:MAG: Hint domain-containing protein [Chloroflexota bacterium]
MRAAIVAAVVVTALVSCAASGIRGPTPSPIPSGSGGASPSPSPSGEALPVVAIRYRLVDELGRPLFCDPDFYPVARADEAQLAKEHFPVIRADAATYAAITARLKIDPAFPSADEILAVYREWKMLNAIALTPTNSARHFDYVAAAKPGATDGWHVTGTIEADGTIKLETKDPSGQPPCPICLARGTRIAMPSGDVAVEDITVGMAVWTTNAAGERILGQVLEVGSTPVPETHRVVHLTLDDGRTLDVSPGHPLPDGRRLGDLRPGDLVDGATVVSADLVAYAGGATFDLLASGVEGSYWANGILIASTLAAPNP